jgi:hypothetical protein
MRGARARARVSICAAARHCRCRPHFRPPFFFIFHHASATDCYHARFFTLFILPIFAIAVDAPLLMPPFAALIIFRLPPFAVPLSAADADAFRLIIIYATFQPLRQIAPACRLIISTPASCAHLRLRGGEQLLRFSHAASRLPLMPDSATPIRHYADISLAIDIFIIFSRQRLAAAISRRHAIFFFAAFRRRLIT